MKTHGLSLKIKSSLILAGVCGVSIAFYGCEKDKDDGSAQVTPKLIPVATANSTWLVNGGNSAEGLGLLATNTNMATVSTLKAPVRAIELRSSSGGGQTQIYNCAADSNDGCLVDLASPTALQDILNAGAATVTPGSYDTVVISTCRSEGGYSAKLTAEATIGATTYYTKSDGTVSATGPAEETAVSFSGCALSVKQPTPVTINDGDALTFRLYFDPRDLVWIGAAGGSGHLPSGCTGDSSATPFVCMAYPNVSGTVDDAAPTTERFRVNNLATIGLIFNSSGGFIGGYSRRYYDGNDATGDMFSADTPIGSYSENSDGTCAITTYGSSADISASWGFKAENFSRASGTSTGTFTTKVESLITGTYSSTKI